MFRPAFFADFSGVLSIYAENRSGDGLKKRSKKRNRARWGGGPNGRKAEILRRFLRFISKPEVAIAGVGDRKG